MAITTTKSSKSNSQKSAQQAKKKGGEQSAKPVRVAKTDEELKFCDKFDEAHLQVGNKLRRFYPHRDNGWTKVLWSWPIVQQSEDRALLGGVSNAILMELTWNKQFGWSAYFVCEHETAKAMQHAGPRASGRTSAQEAIDNAVKSFYASIARWNIVVCRVGDKK